MASLIWLVILGNTVGYVFVPTMIAIFFHAGTAGVFGNKTGGIRGALFAGVITATIIAIGQYVMVTFLAPTTVPDVVMWLLIPICLSLGRLSGSLPASYSKKYDFTCIAGVFQKKLTAMLFRRIHGQTGGFIMSFVRTIFGDISPEEMGITYSMNICYAYRLIGRREMQMTCFLMILKKQKGICRILKI